MPPSLPRLRALSVCVGCTGAGMAFFLLGVVPLRIPLYFPLSRRWGTAAGAGELSMDYYGRTLYALVCALLIAGLTYVLSRRWQRAQSAQRSAGLLLWTAYAATALLLCASLYGYKLFTRQPAPEPLPAWYQPR